MPFVETTDSDFSEVFGQKETFLYYTASHELFYSSSNEKTFATHSDTKENKSRYRFYEVLMLAQQGFIAYHNSWNDGKYLFYDDGYYTLTVADNGLETIEEYIPTHYEMSKESWFITIEYKFVPEETKQEI